MWQCTHTVSLQILLRDFSFWQVVRICQFMAIILLQLLSDSEIREWNSLFIQCYTDLDSNWLLSSLCLVLKFQTVDICLSAAVNLYKERPNIALLGTNKFCCCSKLGNFLYFRNFGQVFYSRFQKYCNWWSWPLANRFMRLCEIAGYHSSCVVVQYS